MRIAALASQEFLPQFEHFVELPSNVYKVECTPGCTVVLMENCSIHCFGKADFGLNKAKLGKAFENEPVSDFTLMSQALIVIASKCLLRCQLE